MSDVRVLTIHMNSDAFRHSILRVRDTLRAIFAKALMSYTDFMTGEKNFESLCEQAIEDRSCGISVGLSSRSWRT